MSIASKIAELKNELPSTVKLVAVSKFHPVEAIREAYDAGQRIFAESRPQEFREKVEFFRDVDDIEWHFIGHLQTNKLKMVLPYVSLVQSVDSVRLLEAIGDWALRNGREIRILLEIHISHDETKQGFTFEEAADVLARMASDAAYCSGVRVCGLMGMASLTDDQELIESEFESLRKAGADFGKYACGRISMDELSFGMSSDYKIAARNGSTMVRIGTMIFGERTY